MFVSCVVIGLESELTVGNVVEDCSDAVEDAKLLAVI